MEYSKLEEKLESVFSDLSDDESFSSEGKYLIEKYEKSENLLSDFFDEEPEANLIDYPLNIENDFFKANSFNLQNNHNTFSKLSTNNSKINHDMDLDEINKSINFSFSKIKDKINQEQMEKLFLKIGSEIPVIEANLNSVGNSTLINTVFTIRENSIKETQMKIINYNSIIKENILLKEEKLFNFCIENEITNEEIFLRKKSNKSLSYANKISETKKYFRKRRNKFYKFHKRMYF